LKLEDPASCPDEETLLAFVEGRHGPAVRAATAAHLDRCAACQELVTAMAPALLSAGTPPAPALCSRREELPRGATIGRYVLLSLIGRGGMGEVYAAYDPELDRKVALKLLHEGGESEGPLARARLLREAKAIAKLSHPNVVTVHDAGTIDDRVFIAMEFVDGQTLADWLKAAPRPWREVLALFKSAGRALAAAHAAGLVHRDFKPQNVMVDADANVRVMDFGLAALTGAAERVDEESVAAATPDAAQLTHTMTVAGLTRTGTLVGTPAYMAPEQFLAEAVDARTDQFSFCVSLYEGLFGERPFPGDSVAALAKAVIAHEVREPAQRSRAPAWLRRVVLRGLHAQREDRYPSMQALLAALDKDPARRTKKWAIGAGVLAVTLGLVGVAHRLGEGQRALCTAGGARFEGIWEPGGAPSERKAAIHRAFAATGVAYAEQAFSGAAHLLDTYVARWTSMYTDACEATHVRGEQSPEALDLRMACLNGRLGNVRALGDVLARADGKVVENAVSAAAALPGLERCADLELLRAVVKPPEDEATHKRVEGLRGELARLAAAREAGHCLRASQLADTLIADVAATGYQPLLAETLYAAAEIGNTCGDAALMMERFKKAHTAASAGRHDEIAALSSSTVVSYALNRLGDDRLAKIWLDVARGDVARLSRESWATAVLAQGEAHVAVADGDFDRALSETDRALGVLRRVLGVDHPWTINAEMNKGLWLEEAGRLDEALKNHRPTLEHFERVLGPDHPQVGIASNNLAEVLNLLGRHAEAASVYRRAVAIFRKSGTDGSIMAWALTGLGRALVEEEQPAAALPPLEEALTIREQKQVPASQLGETRFTLARALWSRPAERPRARELAMAARADLRGETKALAELDAWQARVGR
jgi:tetratricopeptide (TPR) repeat protein